MDLKMRDVAELLNVSEATIRRWLKENKIPAYRLNHQYRFSRIEIENWMMRCKLKDTENNQFLSFSDKQMHPPKSEEKGSLRSGMRAFNLYRAIHRGGVFSDISGSSKEEVIRETTKIIAQRLALDAEVLAELLIDREKLMPTSLNHGIAVPHSRECLMQLSFDSVVVVFPKNPISYGALDGEPVNTLFFLFASGDKIHLHLLAKIAHLGSNTSARELLKSKPDQNRLLEYIKQWEGNLNLP